MSITEFVEEMGGAVSSPQLAEALGVDPALVRLWARDNGVPLVGNSFIFTADLAYAFASDALDEEEEEEEDDYDDDDDDDEEEEEEEEEQEDDDDDD